MLLEEVNDIKYRKYTSDVTEVHRHIDIKKELAEEINKVLAVVNKGNKAFKINNTILFSIAIKKYFETLEGLTTEEIIEIIRKEGLKELL